MCDAMTHIDVPDGCVCVMLHEPAQSKRYVCRLDALLLMDHDSLAGRRVHVQNPKTNAWRSGVITKCTNTSRVEVKYPGQLKKSLEQIATGTRLHVRPGESVRPPTHAQLTTLLRAVSRAKVHEGAVPRVRICDTYRCAVLPRCCRTHTRFLQFHSRQVLVAAHVAQPLLW